MKKKENIVADGCKVFLETKDLYVEQTDSSYKEAYRNIKNNIDIAKVIHPEAGTLLHYACKYNLCDHVKLLVSLGSDVNAKVGRLKNTPLHEACFNPNKVKKNIKKRSSHSESLSIIKVLIKNKANVNAVNKYSTTPLHSCCIEGLSDCTNFLLDNGADFTLKSGKAAKESTALHFAAEYGWASVVKLLLKQGADSQVVNSELKTPYQVAVESTVIFDEEMRKAVCNTFERNLNQVNVAITSNNHQNDDGDVKTIEIGDGNSDNVNNDNNSIRGGENKKITGGVNDDGDDDAHPASNEQINHSKCACVII
jgi:ankyrin repeat protein